MVYFSRTGWELLNLDRLSQYSNKFKSQRLAITLFTLFAIGWGGDLIAPLLDFFFRFKKSGVSGSLWRSFRKYSACPIFYKMSGENSDLSLDF